MQNHILLEHVRKGVNTALINQGNDPYPIPPPFTSTAKIVFRDGEKPPPHVSMPSMPPYKMPRLAGPLELFFSFLKCFLLK